jgi:uncharacterized membrane protein/uncharacterized membrane protein YeaQ/YmgE (transglycosylase-associated protein family)
MVQLLTWTATGLVAGWVARTVMRSRREFGLVGDLLTGWLGALIGGWLARRLNIVAPDNPVGHFVVALAGAAFLLSVLRALRQLPSPSQVAAAASVALGTQTLEERIGRLGNVERTMFARLLSHQTWAADPNQAFDAQATFGDRVADRVASFGGSWTFIGLFGIGMLSWMTLNEEMARPFDPYPYILLNLVLSCLAALQAPVIMMSQNRQAARDRSDARNDYEVNVRAEMEIAAVHAKLDLLREQEWARLVHVIEEQQRALDTIQRRLDDAAPPTSSLPPA